MTYLLDTYVTDEKETINNIAETARDTDVDPKGNYRQEPIKQGLGKVSQRELC